MLWFSLQIYKYVGDIPHGQMPHSNIPFLQFLQTLVSYNVETCTIWTLVFVLGHPYMYQITTIKSCVGCSKFPMREIKLKCYILVAKLNKSVFSDPIHLFPNVN